MFKPLQINYDSKSHLPALGGLRGLAIVMLLLYHCYPSLYKVGTGIGWVGVDLFFVLFGFLITGMLLETKEQPGYFQKFFAWQILRIFPLYYLFLVVFFLLLPLVPSAVWITQYHFLYENQWWYWLYIPNWWTVIQGHWPVPAFNPNAYLDFRLTDHLWLLAVVEQFCIFWLLVVFVCNRRLLIFVCLYLIVQSLVIRNVFENLNLSYAVSYVFTFGRLDALAIGALIAVLIREEKSRKLLEKTAPFVLFGALAVLLGIILLTRSLTLMNPAFIRLGYTIIALLFGALLLYALSTGTLVKKVAETPFLRWFGKYSYGIYIYHWTLYLLLFPVLSDWLTGINNLNVRGFVISSICIGIILLMALASWHLFEKQFLKLKKYVDYKPASVPG